MIALSIVASVAISSPAVSTSQRVLARWWWGATPIRSTVSTDGRTLRVRILENPLYWETWSIALADIGCVSVRRRSDFLGALPPDMTIYSNVIGGVRDEYMPNPEYVNPFRNSGSQRVRYWQRLDVQGVTPGIAARLLRYAPIGSKASRTGTCPGDAAMYHLRYAPPPRAAHVLAAYAYTDDAGDTIAYRLTSNGLRLFVDESERYPDIGTDHEIGELRIGSLRCVLFHAANEPHGGAPNPSIELFPTARNGIVWHYLADTPARLRDGRGALYVENSLWLFFRDLPQRQRVWARVKTAIPPSRAKACPSS